jgi:hypothetical protein
LQAYAGVAMKLDLEKRLLSNGLYYITESEAKILCQQSDPNGYHIPVLPKIGWERKVTYEKHGYWIGLRRVDSDILWTLKELD